MVQHRPGPESAALDAYNPFENGAVSRGWARAPRCPGAASRGPCPGLGASRPGAPGGSAPPSRSRSRRRRRTMPRPGPRPP